MQGTIALDQQFPRVMYNEREQKVKRIISAEEESALGTDWSRKPFVQREPESEANKGTDHASMIERIEKLEEGLALLQRSAQTAVPPVQQKRRF